MKVNFSLVVIELDVLYHNLKHVQVACFCKGKCFSFKLGELLRLQSHVRGWFTSYKKNKPRGKQTAMIQTSLVQQDNVHK